MANETKKTKRCGNCGGTGTWAKCWDVTDPKNPIPARGTSAGVCFRCEGKGFQTEADEKRNDAYDRYRIAREFAAMMGQG